jgi:alpha-tubulin suppressor-like RCC1 family protein
VYSWGVNSFGALGLGQKKVSVSNPTFLESLAEN